MCILAHKGIGMVYACDAEGVAILREAQVAVESAIDGLKSKVSSLSSSIENYTSLGPHKASIKSALQSIADSINECVEPSRTVAELLGRVADNYQLVIDDDPFAALMNSETGSATGTCGSSSGSGQSYGGSVSAGSGVNGILQSAAGSLLSSLRNISGYTMDMSTGNVTGKYTGLDSSVSRIQGSHNYYDDVRGVNPNYVKGSPDPSWNENCQRCAVAYELRRRGYDIQAQPRPTKMVRDGAGNMICVQKLPNDHLARYPFDVWVPPDSIQCTGMDSIKQYMNQWGNGARCEIAVIWKGGNGGHVFNAEQINGDTFFIDPQNGAIGMPVEDYFNNVEPGQIYICRTDDKLLSDKVTDCYM